MITYIILIKGTEYPTPFEFMSSAIMFAELELSLNPNDYKIILKTSS